MLWIFEICNYIIFFESKIYSIDRFMIICYLFIIYYKKNMRINYGKYSILCKVWIKKILF